MSDTYTVNLSSIPYTYNVSVSSNIAEYTVNVTTGTKGLSGNSGRSAYESYVLTTSDDPVMTESEWVDSFSIDSSEFVTLSSSQTITGQKDFSTTPTISGNPIATVVNIAYEFVTLSSTQNITGQKDFLTTPTISGNPIATVVNIAYKSATYDIATTTYTVSLSDTWNYLRLTNAAGCVLSLLSATAWPDDSIIYFRRETSAGSISFSVAGGNVIPNDDASADIPAGGTFAIKKLGTTSSWDFI